MGHSRLCGGTFHYRNMSQGASATHTHTRIFIRACTDMKTHQICSVGARHNGGKYRIYEEFCVFEIENEKQKVNMVTTGIEEISRTEAAKKKG